MNKGMFTFLITAFCFAGTAFAQLKTNSLSPYDVVVPSLNGDPSGASRVAGQLYYDISSGVFKGIDSTGSVKSFNTGAVLWTSATNGIYYSGGPVGIGGTPQSPGFDGLDVQIPTTGNSGLFVRVGTTGNYSAIAIQPEYLPGITNIQGTASNLSHATTIAINEQGGDILLGNSGTSTTINGNVQMASFGAGTCTFDASGNISSSSDERLKTEIRQFDKGLSALTKINPIRYKWNSLSGMETEHEYVGFSAQNVQSALPEGVGMSNKGYLSLQERAIIAALVNSVKELHAEIEQLKASKKK